MSGVNKFDEEGKGKIYHVFVSKENVTPFLKKKIVTSEKVTPCEEVDKGTKHLDDMK